MGDLLSLFSEELGEVSTPRLLMSALILLAKSPTDFKKTLLLTPELSQIMLATTLETSLEWELICLDPSLNLPALPLWSLLPPTRWLNTLTPSTSPLSLPLLELSYLSSPNGSLNWI